MQILISKSPVIGGLFLAFWLRARVYLQMIQFWLWRRVYLQIIRFTGIFCCHRDVSHNFYVLPVIYRRLSAYFSSKLSKMFVRLPIYAFSLRNNEHLRYKWLRSDECRWKRASIIEICFMPGAATTDIEKGTTQLMEKPFRNTSKTTNFLWAGLKMCSQRTRNAFSSFSREENCRLEKKWQGRTGWAAFATKGWGFVNQPSRER